ncbi:MAG: GTP-binding protein [Promethearchaeota archaeon]|nr:MAG: GTP-binding protein [Candidatus Lokiarchaeota archaeon]
MTISSDYAFKICIFGDTGVGKTSLISRYLNDQFQKDIGKDMEKSMGVDINMKKLVVDDIKISLQIWDLVGEERFKIMLPFYLRGSSGCIFMYDITREKTLNNIGEWLNIFKNSTAGEQIPIIMVGGKSDLQEMRTISIEKAMSISKSHDFYDYIECSSKTGENVEVLFNTLIRLILKNAGL